VSEEQQKPFRVEVTIAASQDVVWRALTEPQEIREWFGWDYDQIEPEIRFIFVEHATPEPPDRIVFGNGSHIEVVADGTRTIVRAIFPGPLDSAEWEDVYDGIEEGWRQFFEQLRYLLEAAPKGKRRTVYLSGRTQTPTLDGATWHESRYQRMVVDETGHLVGTHEDGAGKVAVTVSTYGLDDASFAAVREEWAQRWAAVPEGTVV
jgi:uncharacterized protein YndB with AHSA1/START domain